MKLLSCYLLCRRQRGAAILASMIVVAMVTSLTAAAHWQQWRGSEVELAQRSRLQATWILSGALDWAKWVLREDARRGPYDHLAERWAIPLSRVSLTTFLNIDPAKNNTDEAIPEAFLSGRILDLQSRLNLANLVQAGKVHPPAKLAFSRLFGILNLSAAELDMLIEHLILAQAASPTSTLRRPIPLRAPYGSSLAWTGLSPNSQNSLASYVTLLPFPTPVNLNTAPEEILYASIPGSTLTDARRLIDLRQSNPFADLGAARVAVSHYAAAFDPNEHSVASSYFEVNVDLSLEQTAVREIAVLERTGSGILTLWHRRAQAPALVAGRDSRKAQ